MAIFTILYGRGRYPALGHLPPWAILFFLDEKKINICRLIIYKSDLLNLNFVEFFIYIIPFFL